MAREAIFIGYRRDDTADVAGRVFDALESRFGRNRVFKDVDNLRPGADFGEYIKTILPRCRVALILIGPNWVNAVDEYGRRRLDDPSDWVRIEIEIALAAGDLEVVPVLINGAHMPRAEELPPSLHPLLRRHAATIRRDPDFRDDVARLIAALRVSVRTGVFDFSGLSADQKRGSATTASPASRSDDGVSVRHLGRNSGLKFTVSKRAAGILALGTVAVVTLIVGAIAWSVGSLPFVFQQASMPNHMYAFDVGRVATAEPGTPFRLVQGQESASAQFIAAAERFLPLEERRLHEGGYAIQLTVDAELQRLGVLSLQRGLAEFDRRSGAAAGTDETSRVQGALVALDPHTGRILALIGGSDAQGRNRALELERAPGSVMYPFIYAVALSATEAAVTPSTLIDDTPFIMALGDGSTWHPQNRGGDYLGSVTLRRGFELSRTVVAARLFHEIRPEPVVRLTELAGLYDNSLVDNTILGARNVTLVRLTGAFATFVNGGRRVSPSFVEYVKDRSGRTVYRRDQRDCDGCDAEWRGQAAPSLPNISVQVLDPIVAAQMTSLMEGAIERGNLQRIRALGKPVAGFAGNSGADFAPSVGGRPTADGWFVGFSPDLVVGIWMGFDDGRSLGDEEIVTSAETMLGDVFREFMKEALRDQPSIPFRMPNGVRIVQTDYHTGQLPNIETTTTVPELFRPGGEPVPQSGAPRAPRPENDIY
jgi:hypothetical protein